MVFETLHELYIFSCEKIVVDNYWKTNPQLRFQIHNPVVSPPPGGLNPRWKKFSWKIPFLALFAAPISDPGAALTAAPAIAVHVLLLLPRILSDQNPPPPGVYPDVPNFSIDSYDLAPNDQCDKDLFEANPVLDKPSYYCGSRTGQ